MSSSFNPPSHFQLTHIFQIDILIAGSHLNTHISQLLDSVPLCAKSLRTNAQGISDPILELLSLIWDKRLPDNSLRVSLAGREKVDTLPVNIGSIHQPCDGTLARAVGFVRNSETNENNVIVFLPHVWKTPSTTQQPESTTG